MMDVEGENEKELHVLRSAVLASMKAKLKQKEKASKTGSPLGEGDIEHDPELAALRTVALMSKKEREEQARKAAELKRQQQYQFQQGRGAQSNLIMIKTVDLEKSKAPSPSTTGNNQDNKKVTGKFSRYEDTDSEEEEEEEEQASKISESEQESSDAEEQTQSDSNKENQQEVNREEGSTSPSSSRNSISSSADSSSSDSSSSASSSGSSSESSDDDDDSSSGSEDEGKDAADKKAEMVVKMKKENDGETRKGDRNEDKGINRESRVISDDKDKKTEGKYKSESKVFSNRINSDNKRREHVSSRNGERSKSGVSSSKTEDRHNLRNDKESLRKSQDNRHNKGKIGHRDQEHSRKNHWEYNSTRDDRNKYRRRSRERKYESKSGASRSREHRVSGSHGKDSERHYKGDSRGSGKSSDQVRTGERNSRTSRTERDHCNRSDRSRNDRHKREDLRDSSVSAKKSSSKHDRLELRNPEAVGIKQERHGKTSRTPTKSKEKAKDGVSSGKLIHSSDSSFSDSEVESSKTGDVASSESESDSDNEGRSKHRKSERNTEDIERERRKRRIAAREKKEAEKVKEVDIKQEKVGSSQRDKRVLGDTMDSRTNYRSDRSLTKTGRGSSNNSDIGNVRVKQERSRSPFRSKHMERIAPIKVKTEKFSSGRIKTEKDVGGSHHRDSNMDSSNIVSDKKVLTSRMEGQVNKGDRLKPPPALMSLNTKPVGSVGDRDREKSPSALKDSKKADLLKEIERIDQKLAAKRSSGASKEGRMEKIDNPKDIVIKSDPKESSPKSSKLKRKEMERDDHTGEKLKKQKRSTSPTVSVTFDKVVDQTKPAPSKKSVHERLGNIVKESTSTSSLHKPGRRVISLDNTDTGSGDLRNLLHRRKTRVSSGEAVDSTIDGEDNYDTIHTTSMKDFSGRKVMIYEENMFEDTRPKTSNKSSSSIAGVVSTVRVVSEDKSEVSSSSRKRSTEEDRTYNRKADTKDTGRRKIALKRPQLDKDPCYESELDARIKQIKEKNAAILARQRQIEEEKRKFSV